MFDKKQILEIIYQALRRLNEAEIHDVSMGSDSEIVLTTDDGEVLQCFVLRAEDLTETDAPWDDSKPV